MDSLAAVLGQPARMLPEDVAAACRALARTKFFDGDIIRSSGCLVSVWSDLLLSEECRAQLACFFRGMCKGSSL